MAPRRDTDSLLHLSRKMKKVIDMVPEIFRPGDRVGEILDLVRLEGGCYSHALQRSYGVGESSMAEDTNESESTSPNRTATNGSTDEEKQTTASKPNQQDEDNNLLACYHVLGSLFLLMNSWGIINTFGAYQTFYETELLAGQESSSAISWIGSLQAFALVFVGVITGPLFHRGYFRTQIVTGSFLVVFGMMMLSLCSEYWQIMLSQGIVVGLRAGMLFLPSVAVLPMYFTNKRALAQGIAARGSSIGEC